MRSIARKCIKRMKGQIDRIIFRNKLKRMDDMWYFWGGSCWGLFPPSFYYTLTEDEIRRIKEETVKKLYEMIEQMK